MATHAATRNISGLARALAQHGVMSEYEAETLQTQAQTAGVSFVEQVLLGKRMTAVAARRFRVPRVRQSAAGPRGLRPRPDPEGACRPQDGADASRAAAVQAQQQALRRDFRPGQPAGAGRGPVQDQPRPRADRRRGRQARRRRSPSWSRRAARLSRTWRQPRGHGGRPRGRHRRAGLRTTRTTSDIEDAPVVKYIQKILLDAISQRCVGHPLRAVREILPRPLPRRRHPVRGRAAAARDQGQGRVADQGDLQARHLGKARAAGRPDEARPVQDQGDRLPRVARCRRSTARRS